MTFIKKLNEGPAKTWYLRSPTGFGDYEFKKFIRKGYFLDQNSGLFLRPHFNEETAKKYRHTIIDLLFLRPSDYHVHPKMGEAIKVLSGKGKLLLGNKPYITRELCSGSQVYIEPETPHAFSPEVASLLEIEVACTEIYDNTQEETLKRFDHFEPWLKIWNR